MIPKKHPELATRIFTTLPVIFGAIRKSAHTDNCAIAPNQLHILRCIYHQPTTINALAKDTHVSAPTISNAVNALVNKKLVQRTRATKDRRHVHITLTKQGKETMQRAHRNITAELTKHLSTLSDKERGIVMDAMRILHNTFHSTQ